MNPSTRIMHRLVIFLSLVCLLIVTTMAAPKAQAAAATNGTAWHLKVDFPNNQLRVVYTLYEVDGDPLKVTNLIQTDITSTCVTQGALTFDADGYALFDGSTGIRCSLPALPAAMHACDCPIPFWTAADVRMSTSVTGQHPLIEGRSGNTREFTLSVPSNGTNARTRLQLFNQSILSSPWSLATNNQFLLSSKGPGLVDVANALDDAGVSVLDYVPGWASHFAGITTTDTLDLLVQPAGATWSTTFSGSPWIHPQHVFIGYSPTSGTYFTGGLKHLEIDPPGCRGGI